MKYILLMIICLGSFHCKAQYRWQYGLELNYNSAFGDNHQRNAVNALNGFVIFEKHELYAGFDITQMASTRHRLWGFESGYKFHFYAAKKSNFFLDLNYQYSRYCEGCAQPVDYDFVPAVPGEACYALNRVKSNLVSFGAGYELFYTKWLSSSLSLGPGINWGTLDDPGFDIAQYLYTPLKGRRSFVEYFFLLKASIRFTFMH